MGKLKIQPITNDQKLMAETICEMLGISSHTSAFSMNTLVEAMKKLPVSTTLHFDKIYGRWIFANHHSDEWPATELVDYSVSGPNFAFSERSPELAIAKGIHYFYHTEAY